MKLTKKTKISIKEKIALLEAICEHLHERITEIERRKK